LGRRTEEERAVDLLLELIALDAAAESAPVHLGATVFQKILFWSKMQLHELSLALPRLSHRRHHYGPYSHEPADDLKLLRELGHLDRANFRISPRAAEIVRHWTRLLGRPLDLVRPDLHPHLPQASCKSGWCPCSSAMALVTPADAPPVVEKAEPHRNAGGEREVADNSPPSSATARGCASRSRPRAGAHAPNTGSGASTRW